MTSISEPIFGHDLLVLMAKEPRPGVSKTRLAKGLGEGPTYQLAEAFVLDTLRTAKLFVGAGKDRSAMVAFAPDDAIEWFHARCSDWATLSPQPNADLGLRLVMAASIGLGHGAERCVLVGTDCPQIPGGRLTEAFAALDRDDLVLGPASDGGYYLLGLKGAHKELFQGIEWSTDTVLEATLERARRLGLTFSLLEPETDVDEARDLAALRVALAARPGVAPETARRLGALGLDSPE